MKELLRESLALLSGNLAELDCERLASLAKIPNIFVPGYIPTGDQIVHIGASNFFRSFEGYLLGDMMKDGLGKEWGVVLVNLFPPEKGPDPLTKAFKSQDNLYSVLVRNKKGGDKLHVVNVVTSYLEAPSNVQKVVDKMAAASTRIISLTVTENGFYQSEKTGTLNLDHPHIKAALTNKGRQPVLWIEFVMAAARERRKNPAAGAFTLWSFDNLEGNGKVAKRTLLEFVRKWGDLDLADWVEVNVYSPNCMVDRITPAVKPSDRAVAAAMGVVDDAMVTAEEHLRLVFEDDFAPGPDGGTGRPPLTHKGVKVVSAEEVKRWVTMKGRLLNGLHSLGVYLAIVLGYDSVHKGFGNSILLPVLRAVAKNEIRSGVPAIVGLDFDDELEGVLKRFADDSNPDSLQRIADDGPAKVPKYVLPSVRAQLGPDGNGDVILLSLCLAAWFMYLRDHEVSIFDKNNHDKTAQDLHALAKAKGRSPSGALDQVGMVRALLAQEAIFGTDLSHDQRLEEAVVAGLYALDTKGVAATLRDAQRASAHQRATHDVRLRQV